LSSSRIVIVGAGLGGLSVAARLTAAGRDVLVVEASKRAGGQIDTHREPGLVVELGAEGFVARSRAVPELCALLGIEGSLIDQLTTDTYALDGDRLVLLPPGEAARRLGFQVPTEELGRGIRSLAGGMGELIDALVAHLGPEQVRLGTPVAALHDAVGELELEGGHHEHYAALVVATPAHAAAPLLAPLAPSIGATLAQAPVMSNVSVNLLYRRARLARVPAGSGLLFPEQLSAVGLRALSFASQKFEGRAPSDSVILRVFFRPTPAALEGWDDERFANEAKSAIAPLLGAEGGPERCWVSRWLGALPVFSPEYRAQVAELDAALQARGVHLAGSAFHGAGIDAAVASADAVAARLLG
jgi:oxygen-dependent protoporphyrinogen oxidase